MYPDDVEKMAFITAHGTYYYKVMHFRLKNIEATFQRMMTHFFKRWVEVYVDDLLSKIKYVDQHPQHLVKVIDTLRKFGIKLNLTKCTFGVTN